MIEQKLPGGLSVYKKRSEYEAKFDQDYCAASVSGQGGWYWHQCPRKWKVDKRGHRWCTQHDPDKVEKRRRESDARMAPYRRIEKLEAINADLLEALKRLRNAEKDCAGMRCFHSNFDDHPKAYALYDAEELADEAIRKVEETQ